MSRRRNEHESLVERATHDLLNPIASMRGLAETLRDRGATLDDETLRSFGGSIARQAARLEDAIRDLARAERLLREDPPVQTAEVLLSEVAGLVAGDRVRIDAPDGLTVRADRGLLSDTVRRLADNALEHSTDEVVVRAGMGWIEVVDRGSGFSSDGLDAAFEPLSAGVNASNERGTGPGLGLFIARRLVEAMDGTLTATSQPGKGSTFRIELPA